MKVSIQHYIYKLILTDSSMKQIMKENESVLFQLTYLFCVCALTSVCSRFYKVLYISEPSKQDSPFIYAALLEKRLPEHERMEDIKG